MNRLTSLHATRDVTVRQFDHPDHEPHEDPDVEIADNWAIAFVRTGHFDISVHGGRQRLVRGSVFITHPGLRFQCHHTTHCPDDICISVGVHADAVGDAGHAWARAGWAARVSPPPRLAYAQRRLVAAVRTANRFEMERWALGSVAALAADTLDARARAWTRGHYAPRKADLDAVVTTCRHIESDPAHPVDVAERARAVGMTGTQLTHVFRRYVGISPHQYVVRQRLLAATDWLNDGDSVSHACLRSGFENLSHFCRSFQRTFGVTPKAWKSLSLNEKRRKVQDLQHRSV